jgi:anaerobic sulfite reductase subunit A
LYIVCKFRINANEKSLLGVADATLSSDFFCYHNGRITYVFIYYIFHLRKEEEKMGYQLRTESLRKVFDAWSKEYNIYAPKIFEGTGRFSETDVIRYGIVSSPEEIVWDQRSEYSFKEIIVPICQTLFYFTETQIKEADFPPKKAIIFLRSCDLHAVKRLDYMFRDNGPIDYYYEKLRENVKFVLIGCEKSFEDCFCVSMGTNKSNAYDAAVNVKNEAYFFDCKDEYLQKALQESAVSKISVAVEYVTRNSVMVHIPEELDSRVAASTIWDEYDKRCITCGRCTIVCPTCTCWSMQDLFYTENGKAGERRRVQASCMIDGYTDVAGGGCFRQKSGQRMRFKVLHKVLDFKKRAGFQMCVGCGRCDAICPEYISFSHCVNKLGDAMREVKENGKK